MAVDDGLYVVLPYGLGYCLGIGDVEVGYIGEDICVESLGLCVFYCVAHAVAELAVGSGDEYVHVNSMLRYFALRAQHCVDI